MLLAVVLQVAGALLSMGDAHIAQGDSEFDGTGIETSITGKFKITLHKKGSLPKTVKVGSAQQCYMFETIAEWTVTGCNLHLM